MKIIAFLTGSNGGGTEITVVDNYTALLALPPTADTFYWCQNSQGTSWLPGSLGGTYYPKGIYYCLTTSPLVIQYIETPYQATQAEVDAGTVENKFISPKTFNDSAQLTAKANLSGAIFTGNISATNLSGTNTGDETQSSILTKLGWWNILNQTPGSNSISTTQTITKSIALPSVPNFLNFRAVFFKTNSIGAYTVRAYLSEVDNNIGGTAILIGLITGANTAVNNLPMKRTFDIIGGNVIGFSNGNSQVTDDVSSSAVRLNVAIPTGTPLYLIFTVQCINASDSARFESAQINNFSF